MKKLGKKLVALLLAATLVASLALPVAAAEPKVVNVTARMTEPIYEGLDANYWCDHSDWQYNDWESHWHFDTDKVYPKTVFTLHFSDGTTKDVTYRSVEYNKYINRCDISFNGNDCSDPYLAGNTYTATIYPQVYINKPICKEFETELSITVEENPIEDIEVKFSNNIDEGWVTSLWDHEAQTDYQGYDYTTANPVIIFHYTNNTEKRYSISEFQDEFNTWVTVRHNQSISNSWLPGGTYDVTFEVLGKEITAPVTIASEKIVSVEALGIKPLIENISGYEDEEWVWDEIKEEQIPLSYFRYTISDAVTKYKVTYQSGAVVETTQLPGNIHLLISQTDYNSETGVLTSWSGGNTYTVEILQDGTAETDGISTLVGTFEVSVIENPIESVEVEATEILLKNDGFWADEYWGWYDEEDPDKYHYWAYSEYDTNPTITIKYNDGTPDLITSLQDIEEDAGFSVGWGSDQSKETPWTVGGENKAYITLGKEKYYFDVTIVESLIKDVKLAAPIKIFENYDGYYSGDQITAKIDITLWNDEVETIAVQGWDDITGVGRFNFSSNQYESPWTVGGENELKITITDAYNTLPNGNIEINTSVVLMENDTDFYFDTAADGLIITGIKNVPANGVVDIPEEIKGYPVVGLDLYNAYAGWNAKEVIVPDSVKTISQYGFYEFLHLEKITLGSGIKEFGDIFYNNFKLKEINVAAENETLVSIDGVVYNKEITKLLAVGLGVEGMIMLPSTVTDISFITDSPNYSSIKFGFTEPNENYVTIDGITYTADKKTLISCDTSKSGKLVVADTVENLSSGAFNGCNLITEVVLPNTIDTIVYAAFHDCTSLMEVNIPTSVTSIEEAAFANCHSLTEVDLPTGLTYLGNMAFINTGLNDIVIPDGLNTIGYKAFANSSVASVDLGTGVMFMDSAFKGCYNLESIFVPKNVLHFGTAFAYCEELKNVTLEDGLEDISAFAFMNCDSLGSIVIPDSVTRIGAEAFNGCNSLESVVLGDGVISIGEKAFKGAPVSKKLEFGENVSYLDYYAFAESSMTSIVIPNTVTHVTYAAFLDSSKLADITLPENVEAVGQHAFDGTAWYEKQTNGLTYLGDVLYRYKGDVTEPTKVTIKEGTRLIADGAFENLDPNWWEGVGEYYDLSGITEITFPSTLKKIGEYAFLDMYNVEKINLGKATTDAEELDFAFRYLHGLEKITVSADNEKYVTVDGVLYTKDLTTLVYVPRAKTGNLIVPETVTTIANPIGVCGLESITFLGDNVDVNPDNIYYDAGIKLYCIAGTQTEENIANWDYDYETVARMEASNPDVDISITESETGAIPEGSTIEVVDLTDEVPAEEKRVVYDITIVNAGEAVQPNAPVTVSLPAPVEFVAEKCNVFRLEDDGTRTYMDAEYRDGRFYFTTDHFSKYVIEQITHTLGDVNEDGKTTLSDVVTLARYIADWDIDYQTVALDINGDGVVNLIDVTILAQYVAEWEGAEISTKPYIE